MSTPRRPLAADRRPALLEGETLRFSAAVLVTRGSGAELEIYLVRRSPALVVFPGAWALPGGTVDAELDCADAALDLDAIAPEEADGVFLACAARELFEETGLLLPALTRHLPQGAEVRAELRRSLVEGRGAGEPEGRRRWGELVRRARAEHGEETFAPLAPFCWTTTPAFASRRYRALYVHLPLGEHDRPEVWPGELLEGRFVRPADVWRGWLAGEWPLVPPLVFLMDHLARPEATLAGVLDIARRRGEAVDGGALHVVSPVPGVLLAPLRTPTLPPATTTNCYLVGRERCYVVDPATWDEGERMRLFRFLDLAREFDLDLAGVLVTHHHRDHVGSVVETAERYGLPVLAHPETLRRLPTRPREARALDEGDRLPLGSAPDGGARPWVLEVFHTPGHDRGHLVFRESHTRALIAGDLASTLSTIVIEPPEGHLATYLASLARVRALGIGALLPAHGPVAADGDALLARYLEHRAAREMRLVEALGRLGPAHPERLVPEVYADTPRAAHRLALGSLTAGLEKLAEDRAAAQLPDGRWELLAPDG